MGGAKFQNFLSGLVAQSLEEASSFAVASVNGVEVMRARSSPAYSDLLRSDVLSPTMSEDTFSSGTRSQSSGHSYGPFTAIAITGSPWSSHPLSLADHHMQAFEDAVELPTAIRQHSCQSSWIGECLGTNAIRVLGKRS